MPSVLNYKGNTIMKHGFNIELKSNGKLKKYFQVKPTTKGNAKQALHLLLHMTVQGKDNLKTVEQLLKAARPSDVEWSYPVVKEARTTIQLEQQGHTLDIMYYQIR